MPHHTQRHTFSGIFPMLAIQLTRLLPQAFCDPFIFCINFCVHKFRFTLCAMKLYVFWHMQSVPQPSPQYQTEEFHLVKHPCALHVLPASHWEFLISVPLLFFLFSIWKDRKFHFWLSVKSLIFLNEIYFCNFTSSRKLAGRDSILGKNIQLT